MKENLYVVPDHIKAEDIKRLREKMHLSQRELADFLQCSKSTVERWEMSKDPIKGHICLLVNMLERYPDYYDYEEFLKSRCFPESRDKMKLVLKDLGIPFYDPFMIIEKTEGRMADHHIGALVS